MFKRILGWLGVVLGSVGVVLGLAAIVATWWVNGVLTTQVLRLFTPIEQALVFGDEANMQFAVFIANTQTQLTALEEATPAADAVLAELADEIAEVRRLATTANILLASFEPILAQFTRADQLATALSDALATLVSIDARVQQVQQTRTEAMGTINTELDALEARSSELQTAIDETSNDVAKLKRRVPRWIDLWSVGVTLLFVWFGTAQYTLIRSSWRLASPTTQR